jgi:hypothetical protein
VIGGMAIRPLHFPTGLKLYLASNGQQLGFYGVYLPHLLMNGEDFTVDLRLSQGMTLLTNQPTQNEHLDQAGKGTVMITPTYGTNALTWEGYAMYVGPETVTVPAGEYQTLHVRIHFVATTVLDGGQSVDAPYDADYWLADGVGIVKMSEPGVTSQLTSADVVKIQATNTPQPISGGGGGGGSVSNFAILFLWLIYFLRQYRLVEWRFRSGERGLGG